MKMKKKLVLLFILFWIHYSNEVTFSKDSSMIKNTLLTINKEKIKGDFDFDKKGVRLKLYDIKDINKIQANMKDFITKNIDNEVEISNKYSAISTFLIDFRLIKDCNFKIDQTNNSISFTVKQIEDKLRFLYLKEDEKKDDNFNIEFEYTLKNSTAYDRLVSDCQDRKIYIKNLKSKLFDLIQNEYQLMSNKNSMQVKLVKKMTKKKDIESFLDDSNKFVEDKRSLRKISDNQISHLHQLKLKSQKIKQNEIKEKTFIDNRLNELNLQIDEKTNNIEATKKIIIKLEKETKEYRDEENKKKNILIKMQKNYLEYEEIFNKILSDKNNVDYDIRDLLKNKEVEEKEKLRILYEKKDFELKVKKLNNNISKWKIKKKEFEQLNNKENEDLRLIDKKLNELMLERNKKIEKIKENLDIIKFNDDSITNADNEIHELNYRNSLAQIQFTERTKIISSFQIKEDFLMKQKEDVARKFNVYSDNLHHANVTISKISKDIDSLKSIINDVQKNLLKYSQSLNELTTQRRIFLEYKAQLELENKRINVNLSNNDLQIKNFEYEINKLSRNENDELSNQNSSEEDKSVSDIKCLNLEYNSEKIKLEKEINDIKASMEETRLLFQKRSQEYEDFINKILIIDIPGSRVLLDIIRENLNNLIEHSLMNDEDPKVISNDNNNHINTTHKLEKIKNLINLIQS